MGMFIRGLWGDDKVGTWSKALADVSINLNNNGHPHPIQTFVYGDVNFKFLSWLRARPVMMSKEAVCSWGRSEDRDPSAYSTARRPSRRDGNLNWGVTVWRHKLAIIRHAIEQFGEVVWLDWDCWRLRDLPANFWELLQWGRPFQASLLKFRRRVLPWMNDDYQSNFTPHGAFIYCRDASIIDQMIALSDEFPTYIDEALFIKWIERVWGEWTMIGPDRWVSDRYEPFTNCYGNRFQHRRSAEPLFREGKRY